MWENVVVSFSKTGCRPCANDFHAGNLHAETCRGGGNTLRYRRSDFVCHWPWRSHCAEGGKPRASLSVTLGPGARAEEGCC